MNRWLGKVAIVTGASAGIGAQITEQLIDHGLIVIGLARQKEKLAELEKKCRGKMGKFHYFETDFRKGEDMMKASQWIKQNVGVVNIFVNNAGINRFSSSMEGNSNHIRDILETSTFGLCMAYSVVEEMKINKVHGHIIHINSAFRHNVVRNDSSNVFPEYKLAIDVLTAKLRKDLSLNNGKIKVSSISPGYVQTEIINAAMKNTDGYTEDDIKVRQMKEYLQTAPALQPKDVADALIYILSTPPHVEIRDLIIKPVGEEF